MTVAEALTGFRARWWAPKRFEAFRYRAGLAGWLN